MTNILRKGESDMAKNKPRWKELPYYERLARRLTQQGASSYMIELVRKNGKERENMEVNKNDL